MKNVSISQLASILSKITNSDIDYSGNIIRYEISNPLSIANTFIEIILNSIFSVNYATSKCIISFDAYQDVYVDDEKIVITVTKEDNKYNVLIKSCNDSIIKLTESTLDVSVDVVNKEYKYYIRRNDNEITVEW